MYSCSAMQERQCFTDMQSREMCGFGLFLLENSENNLEKVKHSHFIDRHRFDAKINISQTL